MGSPYTTSLFAELGLVCEPTMYPSGEPPPLNIPHAYSIIELYIFYGDSYKEGKIYSHAYVHVLHHSFSVHLKHY
jgi:hypothetical protein